MNKKRDESTDGSGIRINENKKPQMTIPPSNKDKEITSLLFNLWPSFLVFFICLSLETLNDLSEFFTFYILYFLFVCLVKITLNDENLLFSDAGH